MPRLYEVTAGEKYGKWTVIGDEIRVKQGNRQARKIKCRCECGKEKYVYLNQMRNGRSKSCGCGNANNLKNSRGSGKTRKHGYGGTKIYYKYKHMLYRCYDEKCQGFKNYGKRGIKVCEEWKNDFLKFREWALENGYAENLSLERKDVDGDYTPDNCEWIQLKRQWRNKRNTIKITAFGETKSIKDWVEDKRCLVGYSCLKKRTKRNMTGEEMITLKSKKDI